jgi:FKBP-type peptidyl-prolyl cis-trans isomerase
MRTIKSFFLFILGITLLAGCGKVTYRKTPGGMPYQIYNGKGTKKVASGNVVKVFLTYKVKDSIFFTSFGKLPDYIPISSATQPYDISEVWTSLKAGDSMIATQMMDTFIKKNPTGIPPEFKKGDRIITTVKVIDVFENDSLASIDKLKTEKDWLVKETEFISNYLSEKNISTQKTPSGAFVQIISPGTGNLIDSGNYVSVNYSGKTFAGKKIDSNTDTAFHHVGPYPFTVGAAQMIKGFDEGVQLLKPGGSAIVYIPSMLAYGSRPNPQGGIKPFDNLIFEIAIVDVKEKAPEQNPQEMPRRQMPADKPQQK